MFTIYFRARQTAGDDWKHLLDTIIADMLNARNNDFLNQYLPKGFLTNFLGVFDFLK